MRIYLIRHGETDWNKELRLQGREDIPLNECGKKQAYQCGEAMKGLEVDVIVASPLQRAKDTAVIIGERLGIQEIRVEDDLIERDFGEASGLTYQEKNEKYHQAEIPGFEESEVLMERMLRAIHQYAARYPKGHVLMVSHGGSINALISAITNGDMGSGKTRLKNACLSILEVNGQEIQLVDYNLDAEEFAAKYLS